jgi:four helix bundle protein
MKENVVKTKSLEFAVRVVRLNQFLTSEMKEFVISKQVLRSGTSVGAMVREAEHAESKPDFIHKLAIAQKENN